MARIAVLSLIWILVAACDVLSGPVEPPEPVKVECVGIPTTEAGVCQRLFDAVSARFPNETGAASRILIVDTCEPRALCDRAFLYDAVAVIVPPDGQLADALLVHVFGNQGEPANVELWAGPLPAHVVALLNG